MTSKRQIARYVGFLLVCLCLVPLRVVALERHDGALIEYPRKNLVVINSYNESAPWVQAYITPFMLEAERRKDLQCRMVHMNSTLITNDSVYNLVENGIFERFRHCKPDYLVIIGKMGFSMRDRIRKEWGDIPILLMTTNDDITDRRHLLSGEHSGADTAVYRPMARLQNKYNFTFVEIPEHYEQTIDLMVKMQPKMQKLVFVSDILANNVRLNRDIQNYIERKHHGLEYHWMKVSEQSSDSVQNMLMNADMSVGVLLSSLYYCRKSAFGYPMLVTDDIRILAAAPHPVFTLKQGYMDVGAVGGFFPNQDHLREHCIRILNRMLNGDSMKDIPFVYSDDNAPIIDYTLAENAELDLSCCPEDTEFINKPMTMWERYRWHIIIAIVVVVTVIVMLVVILVLQRFHITAQKKQEVALIKAREAAKESDRLKSAFLANMSHEIRTPLNAIVGFSELLADCDDEEERREFVDIINTNNEQLLTLVNDILDLSRVESNRIEFKLQPTDVNELIGGLKASLQVKMKEDVVLNSVMGAARCVIEADQARLSQVLTNFLTNAAKFTDRGSVTVGYEIHGDNLFFFVRDTGRGLTEEQKEVVFQRFVKLNEFDKGIGLGLAICHTLVEKMGGEIGVDSKGEGKGCTFWFTIPYKPV